MPAQGNERTVIPLAGVKLTELAQNPRVARLDRLESYFRGQQDATKLYDWDGMMVGYGDSPVKPGISVPYAKRRPCGRYDLGKIVVRRLTSMLFGADRTPTLQVRGDVDGEDYVRVLAETARLWVRMSEARDLGGAMGTACWSICYRKGKPRMEVHAARHVTVLEWGDGEEDDETGENKPVPLQVVLCYPYPKTVMVDDRLVERTYWYVRYWNTETEQVWPEVPGELAKTRSWSSSPLARRGWRETRHDYGFCPFVYLQNRPWAGQQDGESDYEGEEPNLDELNQIKSATIRGVKANCDPTPVIHADPRTYNGQPIRKGSGQAIISQGGASYLELSAGAADAGLRVKEELRKDILDATGVILADPADITGAAQSAQAMRILYQPMLATCDILREQYGQEGIIVTVRMFLRAGAVHVARGEEIILPPRVTTDEETKAVTVTERVFPANALELNVTLNWPPYFSPTYADIQAATTAAQLANGGKAVASQRATVEFVATMYGVKDVDAELEAIEKEADAAAEKALDMMAKQDAAAAPALEKKPAAEEERPKE